MRIFELQIELTDLETPVWRTIEVPDDIKLHKFHQVLQTVMGWRNNHLHQFITEEGNYYLPKEAIDGEDNSFDEKKYTLKDLINKKSAELVYEYDFSDSWQHQIIINRIVNRKSDLKSAICIEGFGACPPEDIGGSWGYNECLAALKDHTHERHYYYKDMVGEYFSAEFFSVKLCNQMLAKISLH